MGEPMEVWKSIKGHEGLYEVSNTGLVRSIRNNILLKQYQKIDYTRNPDNSFIRPPMGVVSITFTC